MPSPVLVNYDPTLDVDGGWTDWEDFSDAATDIFFDNETPKRKRRKLDTICKGTDAASGKRREVGSKSKEGIPVLSLDETASSEENRPVKGRSIVQWKATGNSPKLPVLKPGQVEKVSILKDWKERFKPPLPKYEDSKSTTASGTQQTFAVVIENGGRFAAARRDSKIYEDVDEFPSQSTTTLAHRGGASKLSRINGSNSRNSTSTLKRKYSSSPDPVSEPTTIPTTTRQSSRRNHSVSTSASQTKRKATEASKQPEPQGKEIKAKSNIQPHHAAKRRKFDAPEQQHEPMSGKSESTTRKENIRPKQTGKRKLVDSPEQPKPEPKRSKAKTADAAATKKENIRPKATAVGKRSMRRK